jgi:hypothetical protein
MLFIEGRFRCRGRFNHWSVVLPVDVTVKITTTTRNSNFASAEIDDHRR